MVCVVVYEHRHDMSSHHAHSTKQEVGTSMGRVPKGSTLGMSQGLCIERCGLWLTDAGVPFRRGPEAPGKGSDKKGWSKRLHKDF